MKIFTLRWKTPVGLSEKKTVPVRNREGLKGSKCSTWNIVEGADLKVKLFHVEQFGYRSQLRNVPRGTIWVLISGVRIPVLQECSTWNIPHGDLCVGDAIVPRGTISPSNAEGAGVLLFAQRKTDLDAVRILVRIKRQKWRGWRNLLARLMRGCVRRCRAEGWNCARRTPGQRRLGAREARCRWS